MTLTQQFIEFLKRIGAEGQSIDITLDNEVLKKVWSKLKKISEDITEWFDATDVDVALLKMAKKLGLIELQRVANRKLVRFRSWVNNLKRKLSTNEFEEFIEGLVASYGKLFRTKTPPTG